MPQNNVQHKKNNKKLKSTQEPSDINIRIEIVTTFKFFICNMIFISTFLAVNFENRFLS